MSDETRLTCEHTSAIYVLLLRAGRSDLADVFRDHCAEHDALRADLAQATREREKLRDSIDEALSIDWADSHPVDISNDHAKDATRIDLLFERKRDYDDHILRYDNALTAAREAQARATQERDEAREMLAECYRLSGADTDGAEAVHLYPYAVAEVRRLREESDAEIEAEMKRAESAERERDAALGLLPRLAEQLSYCREEHQHPESCGAWMSGDMKHCSCTFKWRAETIDALLKEIKEITT